MKTIISSHHSLLNIFSLRLPHSLIALTLAAFAFVQSGEAVNPPPDGGYAGGNTAEGQTALFSLTSGTFNTAVGFFSLRALTDGDFNTATGAGALLLNTADENTANGAGALLSNTTGVQNTGTGAFALFSNTEGEFNTATGVNALFSNTEGKNNTANGFHALLNNTTGAQNTAVGTQALLSNTNGSNNTASGFQALLNNTNGMLNTANGIQALLNNTTGAFNTAMGFVALQSNTSGGNNIALGFNAGGNLTTGFSNIDIGNSGVRDESSTIRIGDNGSQERTFIAGIRGVTTGNADAVNVVVDSDGQLGTTSSSRRFKKDIEPMDKTSEDILALKPVTFHYRNDDTSTPQFGLIAEDVAMVNPDLVVRDKNGEIYTVRYDALNTMLLNEFLKEHRRVQELEALVARQQKGIEALTVGLHKVSAQVGVSALAAKVIATK